MITDDHKRRIVDTDIPYGPLPLADRMAAVWKALPEAEREKFVDDVTRSDNPTLTVYAWEQTLELDRTEPGLAASIAEKRRGCVGGCRCGGNCS